MVQKHIIVLFLLFIVIPSFSQEDKLDIPTNRNYLELDIKNVLVSFSTIDIIFKRINSKQNLDKENTIKLTRYQLGLLNGINFKKPSLDEILVFEENYYRNTFVTIGIGVEKEIRISKLSHYHGIDFIGSVGISSNINVDKMSADTYTIYYRDTNEYRFGINPFLGVKYYLKRNLLIGLETGFLLAYRLETEDFSRNNISIMNGLPVENIINLRDERFYGLTMNFNNLRFLTIGYIF